MADLTWADTPARRSRWIIIHNLAEGKHTGVYHIEVIAITEEALQRSIMKPLQRGDVYPESFDDALAISLFVPRIDQMPLEWLSMLGSAASAGAAISARRDVTTRSLLFIMYNLSAAIPRAWVTD